MRPVRVVAPTSVNRDTSIRIDRAAGPLPSTTSTLKSSMAGYITSSTIRGSRWISSMNNTSPSSNCERMAARSPARSSAGPEVTCSPASISLATMWASVVLPKPGGPANSRWSAGWARARAAPKMMWRCSLSSAWPTNSANRVGRRLISATASSGRGASANSSSRSLMAARLMPGTQGRGSLPPGQGLQCGFEQSAGVVVVGQRLGGAADLLGAVAQLGQRLSHLAAGVDRSARRLAGGHR